MVDHNPISSAQLQMMQYCRWKLNPSVGIDFGDHYPAPLINFFAKFLSKPALQKRERMVAALVCKGAT